MLISGWRYFNSPQRLPAAIYGLHVVARIRLRGIIKAAFSIQVAQPFISEHAALRHRNAAIKRKRNRYSLGALLAIAHAGLIGCSRCRAIFLWSNSIPIVGDKFDLQCFLREDRTCRGILLY